VNARDLIAALLPRARRRVPMTAVLPLVLFFLLFGGALAFFELRSVLMFTSPAWLLLVLVAPWAWWMHCAGRSGLRGVRGFAAIMTRLLLIGAFAMLMAEPRAVRKSNVVSLVYVLDRSDSMGDKSEDRAMGFITQTASAKPQKDECGLVAFGRDAAVELPPRTSFTYDAFAFNVLVQKDGTNIEKALSLAAAILPEEHLGRIVLISDGTQTEGNVSAALEDLKSRGVVVDVLPVAYAYEHEVWLEKLELPRHVRVGETYEAAVVLSSLQAGSGIMRLMENGEKIYEGEVKFSSGKNRFVLPLYMRAPGYYEYVAVIDVPPGPDGKPRDGWQDNNRAVGHIYLAGEGKVLVVTDPTGDERDWETLARTLGESDFVVERMSAYDLTRDPLSLMPYDCIIFVNVPADAMDAVQMEAIHDAVYNQGTGFLMVGGKNSFGPGGYHRTVIEKALPVSMDIEQKKVLPKGALVIILHTCEFPDGNTWAKRIAKEAIRVLGSQDEVGALAYSWGGGGGAGEQWIFPLTPASEYDRLVTLINQAEPGDMPAFGPTMQMGLNGLKASDAAAKHMIIISDGDPQPPTPALVNDFKAAGVTVSTVAINPHGGTDVSLLQGIAQATGGRYYFPQDPSLLPSIFIKEAKTLKRSMVQNVTFVPTVSAPSGILKGIESMPVLHAYVLTTPKERSLVVLKGPVLKGPEGEQVDPVLATWQHGLGKTAAFTSDLSPNWGADWMKWDKYRAFVKQLVTDVCRTEREGHLQMQSFTSGSTGMVFIEDTKPEERFLDMQASVAGPHERVETVKLRQTAPRRYEGRFELWGKGRYQVAAVGTGGGPAERAVGGFVVAYSPEYLRFRSSPAVLKEIAEKTGGRMLTGDEPGEKVFLHDRPPKASSKPIADWFLIAMALLIPLDVGVRRIQLDWSLIRGWFLVRKARESAGETFEALLRRKKAIEFVKPDKLEAGKPTTAALRDKLADKKAKPGAPGRIITGRPEEKAQDEKGPVSTTQRLLEVKRKLKGQDKQK